MREITDEETISLVDRLGPHIDSRYDYTGAPVFPEGRKDVCAVERKAEDGSSYGFDTIYLVWRAGEQLGYERLVDSRATKDYIHVDQVVDDGKDIVVKVRSGGSYSGRAWDREYRRSKADLGLE